ncbi:hypothetical protein FA15DRAFT_662553 [Coprinopsis marcescibilis]|uniref:Cupredoxin n=1 Tax=Coprinopsis marcescibilis TaxID=230819 RepID=A0A5C3LCT3_COPMA|nr:hypothetical protein FA15DRAFT_662553 [Coprinopsis marcescibilis]
MFTTALSLLAFVPLAFGAIIDVQVGAEGKLLYEPEAVFAQPGDQVVFHFHPKNHTVTESSFADPCGRKEGGHQSGFQPVAADHSGALPTYTIDVTNTDPVWVYCAQAARTPNSHCGAGMVFAINCGPDGAPNSFTNFKSSALEVGNRLKAEASATAAPAPSTTAAYGDLTIPAEPTPELVTRTITLEAATWTTVYSSYPGSPAATPASEEGRVHKVIVGGDKGLVFDPPSIQALPRDQIVFEFHQKNHTVTQSSFDDPCRPFNVAGNPGFDSGFLPSDGTSFPTFTFNVTDTAPVWAYCRQRNPSSHCGAGMVFAVNANDDSPRSFAAFQQVAQTLNGTSVSSTADTNAGQGSGAIGIGASTGQMVFTALSMGLVLAAWL